jgi:hypothetical protein
MSYTIFYNKQFIKVDDTRVIPLIEVGDNNVWEVDNKRRARDWSVMTGMTGGKLIVTNDELMKNIEGFRTDTIESNKAYLEKHPDTSIGGYSDAAWGYHIGWAMYGKSTRSSTYQVYKNFFLNGIKNAMTIEELRDNDVTITLSVYRWKDTDITDKGYEIKPDVTFTSTQHMLDTLAEYLAYYGDKFKLILRECGMWRMVQHRKTENHNKRAEIHNNRKAITVDEWYALKFEDGYYVAAKRGGFRYSYYSSGAKPYMTEKDANIALRKINANKNNLAAKANFMVVRINETKTFYK